MAAATPIIVGNWKMNGDRSSLLEIEKIAHSARLLGGVNVAICPPATLIERAAALAPEIDIGAQDCHAGDSGAFTGRLSPSMLADAGARLVIVGHSECRTPSGDADQDVCAKAERALAAGLNVVLCVGEPQPIRALGREEPFVIAQLLGSLPAQMNSRLSIAYEPIWAIGTGLTPPPRQIERMHATMRATLLQLYGSAGEGIRILYGGSANAANALDLLAIDGVDGLLVGGASLKAASFLPIVQAAGATLSR